MFCRIFPTEFYCEGPFCDLHHMSVETWITKVGADLIFKPFYVLYTVLGFAKDVPKVGWQDDNFGNLVL